VEDLAGAARPILRPSKMLDTTLGHETALPKELIEAFQQDKAAALALRRELESFVKHGLAADEALQN